MTRTVRRRSAPQTPLYAVAALVVVATTALVATGHAGEVPGWFSYLAVGGVAGGAGVTTPRHHEPADPAGE